MNNNEPIKIELYNLELNYILTGLQLLCLNLNSIWTLKKDTDIQDYNYANILYLYQYLMSKSNFDNRINLEKPTKKNVLTFRT